MRTARRPIRRASSTVLFKRNTKPFEPFDLPNNTYRPNWIDEKGKIYYIDEESLAA